MPRGCRRGLRNDAAADQDHDINHRSQLDTYAGLNGWEVPQIYGRAAEQIGTLQDAERAKYQSGA